MNHEVNRREDVFNALYDAHYAAVRAYAWRRHPAFADDIVAETFLVAWRRLEEIPSETALRWLLSVSRNACMNIQRGERRRHGREEREAMQWVEEEESASDSSEGIRHVVWEILQRLPAADREVLVLVAWEGLDRAGIAQVLGCSRPNVALRLFRARKRFLAELEASGESIDNPAIRALSPHTSLHTQGVQND
jgi:RNA polymerase sigma-70 factor, ECF subfamily